MSGFSTSALAKPAMKTPPLAPSTATADPAADGSGVETDPNPELRQYMDHGLGSAGAIHPQLGVYMGGPHKGKTPGQVQELLRAKFAGGARAVSPSGLQSGGLQSGGLGGGMSGTPDAEWNKTFKTTAQRAAITAANTSVPIAPAAAMPAADPEPSDIAGIEAKYGDGTPGKISPARIKPEPTA